MIKRHDYPVSPPSDSETTFKAHIVMDEYDTSSVTNTSPRPQSAIRRSRSPPRNEDGQIICDDANCLDKNIVFRRPCEWNKHMDRHERPYKCRETGCELNPGFTYSGGLLRHQREVHKMHLSTKEPYFCPMPNCNRSTGTGFTRKENLEEHKRRRHVGELPDSKPLSMTPPATTKTTLSNPTSPARKRKRDLSPDQDNDDDEDVKEAVDDRSTFSSHALPVESQVVKRLRADVAQRDEMIRRQNMEIQRLQNLIRSMPTQVVYGIMPPRPP